MADGADSVDGAENSAHSAHGADGALGGSAGGPPRHGFWAWLVFVLAVGAVLALIGGCTALAYAPLFSG